MAADIFALDGICPVDILALVPAAPEWVHKSKELVKYARLGKKCRRLQNGKLECKDHVKKQILKHNVTSAVRSKDLISLSKQDKKSDR